MTNPKQQIESTIPLDTEECELLDAVESGAMRSVATPELLEQLRQSAQATGQKDQRINIRLSGADLESIRIRALQLGMPYQTLICSVLYRSPAVNSRMSNWLDHLSAVHWQTPPPASHRPQNLSPVGAVRCYAIGLAPAGRLPPAAEGC